MKISNNFTIQDIHNIRYENYEITKNLSADELIDVTKKHADEFKKMLRIPRTKMESANVKLCKGIQSKG